MEDVGITPGIERQSFSIYFTKDYFQKNDVLQGVDDMILTVISKPHKKWYKVLLQIITLGFYKAPIQYMVDIETK